MVQVPKAQPVALITSPEDSQHYEEARQCVEELALYLKPLSNTRGTSTPKIPLGLDSFQIFFCRADMLDLVKLFCFFFT